MRSFFYQLQSLKQLNIGLLFIIFLLTNINISQNNNLIRLEAQENKITSVLVIEEGKLIGIVDRYDC